jgi:hypothetical protein
MKSQLRKQMKHSPKYLLITILVVVLLCFGCTKHYRVLQDLYSPVDYSSTCLIGDIEDGLPSNFAEEDKPSAEDIVKFQDFLTEELVDKDMFEVVGTKKHGTYLVTGRIMEYNKGSGAGRFIGGLIGGLMNSTAYVVIRLDLTETASNELLFSGSFRREVTEGLETGDEMFGEIASDFAKVLEKQSRKLLDSDES